jgi:hypothetical protein
MAQRVALITGVTGQDGASESSSPKWFVKTSKPPSTTNWSSVTAICRTTTTNSASFSYDRVPHGQNHTE